MFLTSKYLANTRELFFKFLLTNSTLEILKSITLLAFFLALNFIDVPTYKSLSLPIIDWSLNFIGVSIYKSLLLLVID